MSALTSARTVLTVGVCLAFGLHAADVPADGRAADWNATQQAGRLAMQQHDYARAAQIFNEGIGQAKSDSENIAALVSYGIALASSERNKEARSALEAALAEWTDSSGDGKVVTSGILASVDRGLGDYRAAERVLRAAIGDPSGLQRDRAELMVNLADLLREEARGIEARTLLSEAGKLTELPQKDRINILMEVAELDLDLHLCDESRALWNQIDGISGGRDTRLEAVIAGGLGENWLAEGNLARAEPLLRKSADLLRKDPRASSLQVATSLAAVARLYMDEDKLALADQALTEAIEKDESALGPAHPQIAALLEIRAIILSRHGEAQEARNELERARNILAVHFGEDSIPVAVALAGLGDVEQRANRPEAAVVQFGKALQLFREAGADHTAPGAALVAQYAAALKAAHHPDEAKALLAGTGGQGFRAR